jgi:Putative beta-barrel porin 2
MRKLIFCAATVSLVIGPTRAWAQVTPPPPTAAGSTQSIDEVRKDYRLHGGPFYVNPALQLKELGVDSNVFNSAGQQASDFTFTITPEADIAVPMARRGLVKAELGTDLVYYAQYASQRSVDPQAVVRAEAYAQRLTLFVEESYLNTRQRPNYEIDVRSRHLQNDLSGGLAVRFSTKFSVEAARRHGETRFDGDASFQGQRLQDTLNRDSDGYAVTARYKHTALTTIGVRYDQVQDRFPLSPVRDTDSFRVMPGVEFKPKAVITGSAWVGYRSFTPKNPLLPAQSGLVSQLALSYTLLGATTFGVTYDRDYQFAYEVANPYFVDNSVGVFIRRAVGGKFDIIVNAARHRYDYQALAVQTAEFAAVPPRVDTTDNYGVNLGYRLKHQTRVGFGVAYWTRDSNVVVSNAYDRLRIGTTVTYGF